MTTLDRAVRRIARQLEPYEGLLTAVLGLEEQAGEPGRRRVAVIASDHRVFVTQVRGGPVTVVPLTELKSITAAPDVRGQRIRLETADGDEVVRCIDDERRLDLLVSLVSERRGVARRTHQPRVRLIS
jgi:hypothetical protein